MVIDLEIDIVRNWYYMDISEWVKDKGVIISSRFNFPDLIKV